MYINEPQEVANAFADYFSICRFSLVFDEFQFTRANEESVTLEFGSTGDLSNEYNIDFSIDELIRALKTATRKTSPGSDGLFYKMLVNLPRSGKQQLLNIYNQFWFNAKYPAAWKKSIIIPILKPGKDHSIQEAIDPYHCFVVWGSSWRLW